MEEYKKLTLDGVCSMELGSLQPPGLVCANNDVLSDSVVIKRQRLGPFEPDRGIDAAAAASWRQRSVMMPIGITDLDTDRYSHAHCSASDAISGPIPHSDLPVLDPVSQSKDAAAGSGMQVTIHIDDADVWANMAVG